MRDAAKWRAVAPFGQIYGHVAGKLKLQLFDISRTLSITTFSADDYLKVPAYAAAATQAMYEWLLAGRCWTSAGLSRWNRRRRPTACARKAE